MMKMTIMSNPYLPSATGVNEIIMNRLFGDGTVRRIKAPNELYDTMLAAPANKPIGFHICLDNSPFDPHVINVKDYATGSADYVPQTISKT